MRLKHATGLAAIGVALSLLCLLILHGYRTFVLRTIDPDAHIDLLSPVLLHLSLLTFFLTLAQRQQERA